MNIVTYPLVPPRDVSTSTNTATLSIAVVGHIGKDMEFMLILYVLSADSAQLMLHYSVSQGKFLT